MIRLFVWEAIICMILRICTTNAEDTDVNLDVGVYEDENFKYYVFMANKNEESNMNLKGNKIDSEAKFRGTDDIGEKSGANDLTANRDIDSNYVDLDIFQRDGLQINTKKKKLISENRNDDDDEKNNYDYEEFPKETLRKSGSAAKTKLVARTNWSKLTKDYKKRVKERIRQERLRHKRGLIALREHKARMEFIDEFLAIDRPQAISFVLYEVKRIDRTRTVKDELRKMIRILEKPRFQAVKDAVIKCYNDFKSRIKRPYDMWYRPTNNLVINTVKDSYNEGVGYK